MMRSTGEGWLPINGSPIGLVTWYASNGPVVMLASWLAVIDGQPPELRAGYSARVPGGNDFPADADFIINIPADQGQPALDRLIAKAAAASPVAIDDSMPLARARSVQAPLLTECVLQIECVHGRLVPGRWDAGLSGEIVLLHRGGHFLSPASHADFCALQPLRTRLPS